jgi:hypothetical protein
MYDCDLKLDKLYSLHYQAKIFSFVSKLGLSGAVLIL